MRVQFLEIYNEEVRDLLAPPQGLAAAGGGSGSGAFGSGACTPLPGARGGIIIRECPDGQIVVTGGRLPYCLRARSLP